MPVWRGVEWSGVVVVAGDGSSGVVVVRGDGDERGIRQCRKLSSWGRARNALTS